MANTNNIQWKRISAEGAAIVVSILLAFSIQAWWDERRDGASERVMLSSLLAELHATENSFDINVGHVAAIRDFTQQLLNAAVGPNNPLGDRDIDRLLAAQTWHVQQNSLSTPILDSLVSSGDLSLTSDDDLRLKCRIWESQLKDVRRNIETENEFYRDRVLPFLEANTSMQQIYNVAHQQPGTNHTFPGKEVELRALISHRELLSNRDFQNLLTQRISYFTDIIELRPPQIRENLREIIDLIEQELAK